MPIRAEEQIARIAISLLPGIGPATTKKLLSQYGSIESVFHALNQTAKKDKLSRKLKFDTSLLVKAMNRAEKELDFIMQHNIQIHFFNDPSYPKRLKNCDDAPALLFSKGKLEMNASKMVAVVGTRKSSAYGNLMTEKIIDHLAQFNCTLVSGLAYGIDIAAHKKAEQSGIQNIGIVAHGLDMIYPSAHKGIAEKMLLNGGLISEYLSGVGPNRENFPNRNRIIAGMCDVVIVVEAADKGGALITAEIASSYNREVFAIPGRIGDKYSQGCNNLIKHNKAAILSDPADLSWYMTWDKPTDQTFQTQLSLFNDLNEEETLLMECIQQAKIIELDSLAFRTGMHVSKVITALLELEFKGLIKSLPGKRYQLKN
ncbi:MAG: DNA-processing protein DprA [Flavobacteriales bacterium]